MDFLRTDIKVVRRNGEACEVGVKSLGVVSLSTGCVPISVTSNHLSTLVSMQNLKTMLNALPHFSEKMF